MQSRGHFNPGSASFFDGLSFLKVVLHKRHLLKIKCSCHKFKYYFGNVSFDAYTIVHTLLSFFA